MDVNNNAAGIVAAVMAKAREGVAFVPDGGALCPVCGLRLAVVTTRKWSGEVRVRYHKCRNPSCPVCKLGCGIKSVEAEA